VVQLDHQSGTDFNLDEIRQECSSLEEVRTRYVEPSVRNLAQHIESRGHRKLVTADMQLPTGMEYAEIVRSDKLSIRGISDYDFGTDAHRMRLDVLYGGIK
jgi:hypothetical protein